MTEALAHRYSSVSIQPKPFDDYLQDSVLIVFYHICRHVFWTNGDSESKEFFLRNAVKHSRCIRNHDLCNLTYHLPSIILFSKKCNKCKKYLYFPLWVSGHELVNLWYLLIPSQRIWLISQICICIDLYIYIRAALTEGDQLMSSPPF